MTPSEQGSEDISFTDTSDVDDGDLIYCMLICDTDSDPEDVETSTVLPGDECNIPSGSGVVTRKHSYGPDSDTPHPAKPDSSELESNDTQTLPKNQKVIQLKLQKMLI